MFLSPTIIVDYIQFIESNIYDIYLSLLKIFFYLVY